MAQGADDAAHLATRSKNATRNKCCATSNKCLTSSNKKLLGAPGLTTRSKDVPKGMFFWPART